MSEDQEHASFLTRVTVGTLWIIVAAMMALVLFAPSFLPLIEGHYNIKYEKFTNRDDLVRQKMSKIRPITWGMCIIGWVCFFLILMTSNYGG